MKKLLLCSCMITFAKLSAQSEALLTALEQSLLLLEQAIPTAQSTNTPEASIPEAPPLEAPTNGAIPEAPAFDAPAVPEAPAFDAPAVAGWDKGTQTPESPQEASPKGGGKSKAPTGPLPEGIFDELLEAAKRRKKYEEPKKEAPATPVEAGLTVKREVESATTAFKTKYARTDWSKPTELGKALDDLEGIMDNIAKFKNVGGKQDAAIELLKNLYKALPKKFINFLTIMTEAQINSYPTSLSKRDKFKKADSKALGNKRSIMTMKEEIIKMKDI
jgi:hypothetical protein